MELDPLSDAQLEHLSSLAVADAVHQYDKRTRRMWRWKPHLTGPTINSRALEALERRKLARWMPAYSNDLPMPGGRYIITAAGKQFLSRVGHSNA